MKNLFLAKITFTMKNPFMNSPTVFNYTYRLVTGIDKDQAFENAWKYFLNSKNQNRKIPYGCNRPKSIEILDTIIY